ncbi:unnamed protein product [Arctogadus glacialis]
MASPSGQRRLLAVGPFDENILAVGPFDETTLRARGEIELPSTPGKRSVESAAHFSMTGSSPYQIGAIGATFQRSSPSPIRNSAGADDKRTTAFLFTQLRGVLDVV